MLTLACRRVFWENGFRTVGTVANADPKELVPVLMQVSLSFIAPLEPIIASDVLMFLGATEQDPAEWQRRSQV